MPAAGTCFQLLLNDCQPGVVKRPQSQLGSFRVECLLGNPDGKHIGFAEGLERALPCGEGQNRDGRTFNRTFSARALWDLVGTLDLSLYHLSAGTVAGRPGRPGINPHLLIALWLYGYSRAVSSAREISRQCEYEPGFSWLCALEPVNHHTLSDFRVEHKAALDDLFAQVLGMLSAEGLITLERVTQHGTKVKANAGSNTFRRAEKLAAHLALAEERRNQGRRVLGVTVADGTMALRIACRDRCR